jgi:hypothetical protein
LELCTHDDDDDEVHQFSSHTHTHTHTHRERERKKREHKLNHKATMHSLSFHFQCHTLRGMLMNLEKLHFLSPRITEKNEKVPNLFNNNKELVSSCCYYQHNNNKYYMVTVWVVYSSFSTHITFNWWIDSKTREYHLNLFIIWLRLMFHTFHSIDLSRFVVKLTNTHQQCILNDKWELCLFELRLNKFDDLFDFKKVLYLDHEKWAVLFGIKNTCKLLLYS